MRHAIFGQRSGARQTAHGSRKRARAAQPPGCEQARGPEGRARAVPSDWVVGLGGAERARPGIRRAVSSPDRRRLAVPGLLPPARIAPAAARTGRGSCVWHGPARTLLNAQHVRHRPGPVAPPSPACVTGSDRRSGPVAGFARRSLRKPPPASGAVMAIRLPAHAAPRPHGPSRGIPSRLHRNVRDPSGSGSEAIMAWGWRVWMKWGDVGGYRGIVVQNIRPGT